MIIIKRKFADIHKEDLLKNLNGAALVEPLIKNVYYVLNEQIVSLEECEEVHFYRVLEFLNKNNLPAIIYADKNHSMSPIFLSDNLLVAFSGADINRYQEIIHCWINCSLFLDNLNKEYLLLLVKMILKSNECLFTLDNQGNFVMMNVYSRYEYAGITYSLYGKPYFGASVQASLMCSAWESSEFWD